MIPMIPSKIRSIVKRNKSLIVEIEEKPFFVPTQILITTNHGLYIEQYPPDIYRIAKTVPEKKVNLFLRFMDNKPVFSGKQGPNDEFIPFSMPRVEQIKVSAIKMHAMVVTYARTVARMIRRRHMRDKSNVTKGLKSIWVIILIIVVLFIIFMLGVTIVSSAKKDNVAVTVEQSIQPVDVSLQQPAVNTEVDSSMSLTVPAPIRNPVTDNSLPRAIQTEEDIPRGVLIDGQEK